ncbi:hypothetical protein QCE63_33870 [Caballeronia sp. LZ065]|uniref:hypothetical protein n=1 Tax=Caballeronia sp. LZ065 TaxID=3038571 RepID=UPI0028591BA9|nr:hypothetical protein [Caballeronia sp. LZ065]MDR5784409.1 hypothetical protein [Caballeronia sp. LZ065]
MSPYPTDSDRRAETDSLARGLGIFSLALGFAELLAARRVAKASGVRADPALVRLYGMREIACGVGILGSRDPSPYLIARIGGDALDFLSLIAAPRRTARGARHRVWGALLNVATVTALDVYAARSHADEQAKRRRARSEHYAALYGDRSGFPRPPDAMRGDALRDSTG